MRRTARTSCLGLACWSALGAWAHESARGPGVAPSTPALPEAIVSSAAEFLVPLAPQPYALDAPVALYVSVDSGASWQRVGLAPAGAEGFAFRATQPGDHWFAVRSETGAPWPDRGLQPELRVVVDPGQPAASPATVLPAAQAPAQARWVASLTFDLDYDVPAPANAGVELWQTGDAGATWRRLEQLTTGRGPLRVTVAGPGLYGFKLFGSSGTRSSPAPAPGTQPDMWVAVDNQPPVARLTTVEVVHGPRGAQLVVNWTATDTRLAQRPVTLEVGASPAGPWRALGGPLDAIGPFRCPLTDVNRSSPTAPIYLRLTVCDHAGLTTVFVTPEPIPLPASDERTARRSSLPPTSDRGELRDLPTAARWLHVVR